MKILYAEDESILREMYRSVIMEGWGYQLEAFGNPIEALTRFKSAPGEFWLLLTDAKMPGMHGNDLIREIKKIKSNISVVMMSGYLDEEILPEINIFLQKPCKMDDLKKVIRELHQKAGGSQ